MDNRSESERSFEMLVDSLKHRPVGTTAAQMREAAMLLARYREALQLIARQYSDRYAGYPEAQADQMARNDLAGIAQNALENSNG